MKFSLTKKITTIALIAFFSQLTLAQANPNGAAFREIADIVASLNHFPSDGDKAKLMAISSNDALAQPLREMATAVANISHAANAEGKAAMAGVQANSEVPDRAKELAGIIASLSHTPSAEAKAALAAMFQ